jgi:hypothetical protein
MQVVLPAWAGRRGYLSIDNPLEREYFFSLVENLHPITANKITLPNGGIRDKSF